MSNHEAHILSPRDMTIALDAMITLRRPTFLWGSPGIGKSEIVASICEARGLRLIDMRASQRDPIDLRGIPTAEGDSTKWLIPDELPRDGEGVIFLDELNHAPPLTQSAFYQLILDRRLGDYVLPDGWAVIAAGNLDGDRALTQRMSTALANRFTHLQLAVDVDQWCEWAIGADVCDEVLAYIRFRPDQLHAFDPKSELRRFPTPRGWAAVSKIIGAELPANVEYATIAGTVGDGSAAELAGFLKIFRKLQDPDTILIDPENAKVPEGDPATLYAISTMLSRRADSDNFDRVWTYARRMPEEFTVLTMIDATRRDPELAESRAWIEFASTHAELVL